MSWNVSIKSVHAQCAGNIQKILTAPEYTQSKHRVYTAPEYTYGTRTANMKPLERHMHLELGEKYEIPEVSFFNQNAFCTKTWELENQNATISK